MAHGPIAHGASTRGDHRGRDDPTSQTGHGDHGGWLRCGLHLASHIPWHSGRRSSLRGSEHPQHGTTPGKNRELLAEALPPCTRRPLALGGEVVAGTAVVLILIISWR